MWSVGGVWCVCGVWDGYGVWVCVECGMGSFVDPLSTIAQFQDHPL